MAGANCSAILTFPESPAGIAHAYPDEREELGIRGMHELSICQGIIEVAAGAVPASMPRVSAVSVRIGRLTGVVADSLRYHFDLLSRATPLAGATLVIEEVPIRGRCADCASGFQIDTLAFTCPVCGSGFVELLSGRELEVVSIDVGEEMADAS